MISEASAATVRSTRSKSAPKVRKTVPSAAIIAESAIFFVCFIPTLYTGNEIPAHALTEAVKADKVRTAVAGIV